MADQSIQVSRANELRGSLCVPPASKTLDESAVAGGNTASVAFADLLTAKECADYRRCSIRKLDRERAEGRGCAYLRIDHRIFYRKIDVDRFLAAHLCGGELRGAEPLTEMAPGRRNRPGRSGSATVTP
jgi:hypothetical protein